MASWPFSPLIFSVMLPPMHLILIQCILQASKLNINVKYKLTNQTNRKYCASNMLDWSILQPKIDHWSRFQIHKNRTIWQYNVLTMCFVWVFPMFCRLIYIKRISHLKYKDWAILKMAYWAFLQQWNAQKHWSAMYVAYFCKEEKLTTCCIRFNALSLT